MIISIRNVPVHNLDDNSVGYLFLEGTKTERQNSRATIICATVYNSKVQLLPFSEWLPYSFCNLESTR